MYARAERVIKLTANLAGTTVSNFYGVRNSLSLSTLRFWSNIKTFAVLSDGLEQRTYVMTINLLAAGNPLADV